MIWNLLTNAVKFTPTGGKIHVGLSSGDGSVQIAIKDTGIGIRSDFIPFVFDRFRQEDSSSTRSHDGLGLGLAIVRHLSELHGGDVSVKSDGPGKGSCFTISMPLNLIVKENPTQYEDDGLETDGAGQLAKLAGVRVLIVDDDKDACNMLEFALGSSGAEVRTSLSVSQAFDHLSHWSPDVLLTDINMPGEDGYSLINRLRASDNERQASVPAIALTAMARPEDGEKAVSAGFQLHLPKPVDIEELTRAIARLAETNRPLDHRLNQQASGQ
jgi:CheY-like chemotaxis protein